ncbi:Virulence protein, partial [Monkeypox virus]
NTYYSKYDF